MSDKHRGNLGVPSVIRFLVAAALAFALPAGAAEKPFLGPSQVNLLVLLPPPPLAGSAQDAAEMAEVLAVQGSRTPDRTALAVADAEESVFDMFGRTLGEAFKPANLPLLTRLFERLGETEEEVVTPAKNGFARPRPHLANPAVKPAVPLSKSGAYPSGHATRGTLEGIVLAAMLPEKRPEIFARAADYAESRVVGGIHYRSDIVAGAQAGTAMAAVLFNDPQFKAEFGPARAEVRRALNLPQ